MIQILKPEYDIQDERGFLKQLVSSGWSQVNIIYSEANSTRGGHLHKENEELFYVIDGNFDLMVRNHLIEERFTFSAGDMFIIKKGIFHTFYFNNNTSLISMYDKGVVTPQGMDIYRE